VTTRWASALPNLVGDPYRFRLYRLTAARTRARRGHTLAPPMKGAAPAPRTGRRDVALRLVAAVADVPGLCRNDVAAVGADEQIDDAAHDAARYQVVSAVPARAPQRQQITHAAIVDVSVVLARDAADARGAINVRQAQPASLIVARPASPDVNSVLERLSRVGVRRCPKTKGAQKMTPSCCSAQL
jgi:hypothetical protein